MTAEVQIRAKMHGRKDKIREFDFDSEMREEDAYDENPLANNTDTSLPSQEVVEMFDDLSPPSPVASSGLGAGSMSPE